MCVGVRERERETDRQTDRVFVYMHAHIRDIQTWKDRGLLMKVCLCS